MKKLKKILLIHWLYFEKQLIEVGDINFLTGYSGAGKTTIIDALQIVLLGETNARNFNQAANEKSQRTLDGYLRADTDENSPASRRGKDFSSYIACEFLDETEGTYFVTGVVFDCRSDGTYREQFFIYDGKIPENCFLENQEAMDISKLRSYLKQNYGMHAKLYDTQKQYRSDMLAKWNVHNEQVCRMLKKAVSFRPIVDIQKFITENICDIPNKPDIEAMQQNIRDYKRQEQLAQRQEEKLVVLQEIGRLYREWQATLRRYQEHEFLVHWAEKEDVRAEIDKQESEKETCVQKIAEATAEFERISVAIDQKGRRKEELIAAREHNDVYQEQKNLTSQKEYLKKEQQNLIERLNQDALKIERETATVYTVCQRMHEWPTLELLHPVVEAADALQQTCSLFANRDDNPVFAKPFSAYEAAGEAAMRFAKAVRENSYKTEEILDDLGQDKAQKEATLSNLRENIKDYPKGLLQLKDRLLTELQRQTAQQVQIDILADVLEIPETEETWRSAVEGYLHTQKFYLLVEPKYYQRAVSIYNQIKHEYSKQSFGLVDIEKLRERETIVPRNNSLAQKIETQNDLARTYIDYLLGRVICCTHVDQLRNHSIALTADGMLYQGYVVRPIPKDRMEDTFIGRRAIDLRMARLRAELKTVAEKIATWTPISRQLHELARQERLFAQPYFLQEIVPQRQKEHLRRLEISDELAVIEERISHLDLTWLEQIKEEIQKLEEDINSLRKLQIQCRENKAVCEDRIKKLDFEILPRLWEKFDALDCRINEDFPESFKNDTGIPRYQQELKRLGKPSVVAKNFGDHLPQTNKEKEIAQGKLFSKRRDYVQNFQPCAFCYDAMDNDEFAEEQRSLEESVLPEYRKKMQAARESAMEQFQNDFLAKLKSSIDQVQAQVKNLNKVLKSRWFGTEQYQFCVDRNPDYAEYYDMIMAPELMEGEAGLFAFPFQQKYGKLIEELFSRIATSDDTQLNARKQSELNQNIERYTDFRTYLKFDLETTNQNGTKQLLSRTLNTKSGGESQTPFYIAILASFAQLYQVNNLSGIANNTVRLVVFDEAFNKMDSNRITKSVCLLREMHLQAIICTPPDKISDIMPLVDRTLYVSNENYQMHILPYGKEIPHE